MCKAIVKKNQAGETVITLNAALHAEPLALYVDSARAKLKLRLCGGQVIPLGTQDQDGAIDALADEAEVTIQSVIGGLLTAGYRVGIRSAMQ